MDFAFEKHLLRAHYCRGSGVQLSISFCFSALPICLFVTLILIGTYNYQCVCLFAHLRIPRDTEWVVELVSYLRVQKVFFKPSHPNEH